MTRRLAVMLLATPFSEPPELCDEQVTRAWNTFAVHAKDYLDKRNAGVRDVKLRARMYKDFESLMSLDCF